MLLFRLSLAACLVSILMAQTTQTYASKPNTLTKTPPSPTSLQKDAAPGVLEHLREASSLPWLSIKSAYNKQKAHLKRGMAATEEQSGVDAREVFSTPAVSLPDDGGHRRGPRVAAAPLSAVSSRAAGDGGVAGGDIRGLSHVFKDGYSGHHGRSVGAPLSAPLSVVSSRAAGGDIRGLSHVFKRGYRSRGRSAAAPPPPPLTPAASRHTSRHTGMGADLMKTSADTAAATMDSSERGLMSVDDVAAGENKGEMLVNHIPVGGWRRRRGKKG